MWIFDRRFQFLRRGRRNLRCGRWSRFGFGRGILSGRLRRRLLERLHRRLQCQCRSPGSGNNQQSGQREFREKVGFQISHWIPTTMLPLHPPPTGEWSKIHHPWNHKTEKNVLFEKWKSEERCLSPIGRDPEMIVSQLRRDAASRCPVKKPYLHQERLVDFFDCVGLFG